MARSDVRTFSPSSKPVVFGSSARFKIGNVLGYLVVPILALGVVARAVVQGFAPVGWALYGLVWLYYLYFVVGTCWNAKVLRGTSVAVRTVFPYGGPRNLDLTRSHLELTVAGKTVLTDVPSMRAGKVDPVLSIRADDKRLELRLRRGIAPDKLLALAAAITDSGRSTDEAAAGIAAVLTQWAQESAHVRST